MKKPKKKKSAKLDILVSEAQRAIATARYDQAESICRQILELDAANTGAVVLRAQIAFKLNRPTEAARLLQRAIDREPTNPQFYAHLAMVLNRIGQADNAVQAYRYAVSLKPDFLEARLAAGNVLYTLGRYSEAEAEYRGALGIRDDHAPVYYNLALAQAACDNVAEAMLNYEHAVRLKPDYHAAYFNLANLRRSSGDITGALDGYRRAANLAPEQKLYWQQFARCFRLVAPDDVAEETEYDILRCLNIDGIDHSSLTKPVTVLAARRYFPELWAESDSAVRVRALADAIRSGAIVPLCQFEPLRLTIQKTLTNDRILERFLTDLRCAFAHVLGARSEFTLSADMLLFVSALAQQCFLNEYVYMESPSEKQIIDTLGAESRKQVEAGGLVSDDALALIGCYRSLGSLFSDDSEFSNHADLSSSVNKLIELQITEPRTEKTLASSLPVLAAAEPGDDAVREQYERNPYPRWVNLPFTIPRPVGDVFGQLFPHLLRSDTRFPMAPKILIAGCGTGKHALMTARRFVGGRVIAIDASLNSLAFAARQAQSLAASNVTFAHADIMRLDDIHETFDIIEAVGVLHHLINPLEGWKRLLIHLRPGGFMKVGLYSEFGRRPVRAAQDLAKDWGLKSTAADIREFRRRIFELENQSNAYEITRFSDFYSLSGCRDLAFHEKEQWFTLPQVDNMIQELGLTFLGFELDEQFYLRDYKALFPHDPDAVSLECWHQYELQRPEVFASMYQFWVRRTP